MKLPTNYFGTVQRLSTIAAEEASRFGQHTVDIDHLFLALVADGEEAGVILRDLDVTLAGARQAVQTQRSDQLAVLGIAADLAPGAIRADTTADFDFSDRTLELLRQRSPKSNLPMSVNILQLLLSEPSGLIDELLVRLAIDREQLATRIAAAPSPQPTTERVAGSAVSATTSAYVTARVSEVRDFLADPATLPRWVPGIDRLSDAVEPFSSASVVIISDSAGATLRRREATLLPTNGADVSWEFSFLDTPRARPQRLDIRLSPEGEGTRAEVRVTFNLRPRKMVGAAIRRVLRPVHLFSARMYGRSVGNQINRAFR